MAWGHEYETGVGIHWDHMMQQMRERGPVEGMKRPVGEVEVRRTLSGGLFNALREWAAVSGDGSVGHLELTEAVGAAVEVPDANRNNFRRVSFSGLAFEWLKRHEDEFQAYLNGRYSNYSEVLFKASA